MITPGLSQAAIEELRVQGAPGSATIELLRALARQYTRSPRCPFPAPDGMRWSDGEAIDELLGRMFAREHKDYPGESHPFVVICLAKATDAGAFERLLLRSIENFLKDEAKGTSRGKVRRRLDETLLKNDERFVNVSNDLWCLTEFEGAIWQGDLEQLEDAAFSVRGVEVLTWNTAGPTSKDSAHAVLTVVESILREARGAVRTQDLTKLLQARFVLLNDPLEPPPLVERDDESTPSDEPAEGTWAVVHANDLFAALSPKERALVPVLHDPSRWAAATQLGSAESVALARALKQRLALATHDDEDYGAVLERLLDLCTRVTSSVQDD
ncbi:hypothetical protein [Glycomyces sp. NPDC048151]|uniref:hypothetical protein n=1 Tax=Glycomyces sp. NPDC048151 TaxID=3364002 RepID=UPI0037233BDB